MSFLWCLLIFNYFVFNTQLYENLEIMMSHYPVVNANNLYLPPAPFNLTPNLITSNSISLTWNISSHNTRINYFYLVCDVYVEGRWYSFSEKRSFTTSASFTGLWPSTQYLIEIYAVDEFNSVSAPSKPLIFFTENASLYNENYYSYPKVWGG